MSDRPIRVLLVDDQPIVDHAVRRMLATYDDVALEYCSDGREALAVARRLKPTVILQDLLMPDVDGLEMVSAYRADPATRGVPLIVLSGLEDPETKVAAFQRGANDYLVKLPHELELVARIRYHSAAYIGRLERDHAFAELEKHSKFIRDVFGRYVSDEVVHSLLESPGGLNLGGEKRRVTVLMADLRGFTAMSEQLAPEAVVSVLNNFLEAMISVIVRHGGTIDEILGDAILVIFGAPIQHDDDARRAVACAIDMQLAIGKVNGRGRLVGLPAIEMGIGVHTGDVVAGNIGSRMRAKYGVVGSTVNLTSRIESYTVGGQILISAATRDAAGGDLRIDDQLEVSPKGAPAPITLYEIGGIGEPRPRSLPIHDPTVIELDPPIEVAYAMLEGKHHGPDRLVGHLVKMSEREADVLCELPPRAFTDVCIELRDDAGTAAGEVYGKVLPRDATLASGFRVRFTSVSPPAAQHLKARSASR